MNVFPTSFLASSRRSVFLAVLAALFLSCTTGYSFTAIYAFGDSLTDTGRNPSSAGYYQGRFSNGPLWVEYLSTLLSLPYNASNNLAFAGSTTSDLAGQIASRPLSANLQTGLSIVWSGPNDFLIDGPGAGTDDAAWNVIISNAVQNITNAVKTLYVNSAREVIVGNLANLGQTPDYNTSGTYTNYLDAKVAQFNSQLGVAVTNLMHSFTGLRIYYMNANQMVSAVLNSPATYGFTVTSKGALLDPALADKSFGGPGANYLFWDLVHPTTKMHAIIGQLAYHLVGAQLDIATSATALTVSNLYPGFSYSIQGSTNLTTWTNFQTFTAATTNQNVSLPNGGATKAFYRVQY